MAKASNPLTQQEIARLLGVEPRSIRNYHKSDPPIPTERRGKDVLYPDAACVQWMIQRRLAEVEGKGPSELDLAKQRKEVAAARKLELEVSQLEGELMAVAVHEQRFRDRCEELAARCKGLGRFVAEIRACATDEEADAVSERMEDELLAALQETADDIDVVEAEAPDAAA